jgi:hypothetical protein
MLTHKLAFGIIVALTLSDQTASTVDTSRVELHEFEILEGQTRTGHHRVTVTRARVCARAREVCTPVATRCEHSLVRAETVERTILHVECDHTHALTILHDEVEREVLDEEVGVVAQ